MTAESSPDRPSSKYGSLSEHEDIAVNKTAGAGEDALLEGLSQSKSGIHGLLQNKFVWVKYISPAYHN